VVISDALRGKIDAEITRFPAPGGAMLAALHLVQAEHGCVSPEIAGELAEIFDILPVEVMELVTFYNMFDEAPTGRHRVRVCTSLTCALRGASTLLRGLEAHLGVQVGGSTRDGRIHLGREECLGACSGAPMMRIDDAYHEDLDLESASAALDALE